jgi:hypothetical protein
MVDVANPAKGPAKVAHSSGTVPTQQGAPGSRPARGLVPRLEALLRREPVTVHFDRREALTAAGIYLALSAVGFGLLMAVTHHLGFSADYVLRRWDSENYLKIAESGYPNHLTYRPDGIPTFTRLAFFPLVPALIRGVHLAFFGALAFPYAGVLVSWAAGAVAAAGVHTLSRSLTSRRVGYACVGLWACSPYAFALWVPYSEACFSATLMWTLVALIARRWITAAMLCVAAGTIRPTASVLVGVLVLTAAWSLLHRRGGRRPWIAMIIAPLGLVFSWLYLGSRIGQLNGWFEAEKAWGQSFDFGLGTLRFLKRVILYQHIDIRYPLVLALILLVAIAVTALAVDRRIPWALVLALAGAWELMVSTPGSPLSKPRFMLPFLPIMLLLVAKPVARLPRPIQGGLYVCGTVFAGWYAIGLLVLFKMSP